jgi:hypothetical protein
LYTTDESPLALEQLADIFSARSDGHDLIPAIEPLGLGIRPLDRRDLDRSSVIEFASSETIESRLVQLSFYTDQKLRRPAPNETLQTLGECTICCYELEATVHSRHRRYRQKSSARSSRQSGVQTFGERLARRSMAQEHRRFFTEAGRVTALAYNAAIDPHLVASDDS